MTTATTVAQTHGQPPTLAELLSALSAAVSSGLDPNSTYVLVSTHYDNDIALSSEIEIDKGYAYPSGDGSVWINDTDARSGQPGTLRVITLTGTP